MWYWAHTEHEVWATGNQDLTEKTNIPGTVEPINRRDGDINALGEQDASGHYEWWPDCDERLHTLTELFPDVTECIVMNDLDLRDLLGRVLLSVLRDACCD